MKRQFIKNKNFKTASVSALYDVIKAEPIISILPPVPAEKANACHKGSSIKFGNIPIEAATNGTLSMIADKNPIFKIEGFSYQYAKDLVYEISIYYLFYL